MKEGENKNELENKKLIKHTFLISLFLSFIFPIEGITKGPFQKVIVAPISEEPFKFTIAFCLFYYEIIFIEKWFKKQIKVNHMSLFQNTFVYFSMLSGICFGLIEYLGGLPSQNIISHFSFSIIGATLIVFWFNKVKYPYKKAGFLLMGVSMLLHSISNQYANLKCVTDKNAYLVVMAKFLQQHTPLIRQWDYIRVIYCVALALFLIYFYSYTFPELKKLERKMRK